MKKFIKVGFPFGHRSITMPEYETYTAFRGLHVEQDKNQRNEFRVEDSNTGDVIHLSAKDIHELSETLSQDGIE